MKKTFKIEDLDCPNCAAKLEKAVNNIDAVERASVSFIAQKMIVETSSDDIQSVYEAIVKAAAKAVPDCRVVM